MRTYIALSGLAWGKITKNCGTGSSKQALRILPVFVDNWARERWPMAHKP